MNKDADILHFSSLFNGEGLSYSEKLDKLCSIVNIKRKIGETDEELSERLNSSVGDKL